MNNFNTCDIVGSSTELNFVYRVWCGVANKCFVHFSYQVEGGGCKKCCLSYRRHLIGSQGRFSMVLIILLVFIP